MAAHGCRSRCRTVRDRGWPWSMSAAKRCARARLSSRVAARCGEFLIKLGVDTCGREYAAFNKQMRALAACRMTLGFGARTVDAKPIKQFVAWTDQATGPDALAPGTIEISPEFFSPLTEAAVPLDARALSALHHPALALDVYC